MFIGSAGLLMLLRALLSRALPAGMAHDQKRSRLMDADHNGKWQYGQSPP